MHREQNPVDTHQLYSRLISCTRKISTLHLEFKCVCVCLSVCVFVCVRVSEWASDVHEWAGGWVGE